MTNRKRTSNSITNCVMLPVKILRTVEKFLLNRPSTLQILAPGFSIEI